MKTTTVETSRLSGAALDWAVAKAVGQVVGINMNIPFGHSKPDGDPFIERHEDDPWPGSDGGNMPYSPSTDWSQSGPLIDEYDVGLVKMEYGDWCAAAYCTEVSAFNDTGPTPLIAAMRAIVAAELGDDVEVPAELVEASNA